MDDTSIIVDVTLRSVLDHHHAEEGANTVEPPG